MKRAHTSQEGTTWGGGGMDINFLPQMKILMVLLGHRVTQSCKVTETSDEYDAQIARNHIKFF